MPPSSTNPVAAGPSVEGRKRKVTRLPDKAETWRPLGGCTVVGALTVSRKAVGVEVVPSLTDTVIVAVPVPSAAGVTVTVRLAPLPPNTMFAFGTRAVFDELPDTVRLPAGVSRSPTVKASAAVLVFAAMV